MSGFFQAPAIPRPRGTAALSAQVADSTTAGGNARGANAVDLQTTRIATSMVANGAQSVIGGGDSNTASATGACVPGGVTNVADGAYSVAMGRFGWVRSAIGKLVYGSPRRFNSISGSAQLGEQVLSAQTTDATLTRATSDGSAAGTTNTANLPNFSVFTGRMIVAAKKVGSTDCATWHIDVGAVRGNGVGTAVLFQGASSAVAPTASNGTVTGMALTIAADTTNGGIAVSVTGVAATTINWVVRFLDVEVVAAS